MLKAPSSYLAPNNPPPQPPSAGQALHIPYLLLTVSSPCVASRRSPCLAYEGQGGDQGAYSFLSIIRLPG